MATAKICDKCGRVLKYACNCKVTIYTHPYGDLTYELCDKCKDGFINWIKSDPFYKFRIGGGFSND